MSTSKLTEHIIARKPSRADTRDERTYRDDQRVAVQGAELERAEQLARQELADAIRWLTQACSLDTPPGEYVPSARLVRSFASAAMNAADRARIERRKAARRVRT
jgi:hypothetical protein